MALSELNANEKGMRRLQHAKQVSTRPQHGMAFIVEAVVLLAFIAMAITVFFRLFAYAETTSVTASQLSEAVALAGNTAEEFALSPASMDGYSANEDGLAVACSVAPSKSAAGTLYRATITVSAADTGEELYTLATSKYVSGVV